MQQWEYRELVQIVDAKIGDSYWADYENWKMWSGDRMNREAEE